MTDQDTAPAPRLKRRNYGRGHGYLIDGAKVLGVTSIIDVLDKPALRNWYAEQAAKRAVNEWDKIAEMPVSDRLEYIRWGPRDTVRAAALRGTQIHDYGHQLAEGADVDVPAEHRGPVEAYARFLDAWDVTPLAAETPLCSITHQYGGTADLWARIGARDNALALLDVKTGKGVYSETGLQLAAYRNADLMQPSPGTEVPVQPVDLVYVAHVGPDSVRMLPIEAGPDVFRTFLYALQVKRAVDAWSDWPLVGSAVDPDGRDEA